MLIVVGTCRVMYATGVLYTSSWPALNRVSREYQKTDPGSTSGIYACMLRTRTVHFVPPTLRRSHGNMSYPVRRRGNPDQEETSAETYFRVCARACNPTTRSRRACGCTGDACDKSDICPHRDGGTSTESETTRVCD